MALKAFVLWGIEDDFGTRTKTVIWKLLWMLVASERLCISNEPCPRNLRWGRVSLCQGCLFVLSHIGGEDASRAASHSWGGGEQLYSWACQCGVISIAEGGSCFGEECSSEGII